MSAILHGVFLLISATIAWLMNMIPLASLAAILLMVGYKLAKPALFKQMYKLGWEQFIPFTATVVAILLTDLLKGITIGFLFGIFYTLRHSYRNSHYANEKVTTEEGHEVHQLVLAEEVSFLNKGNILQALQHIPDHSKVIIDGSGSATINYDVIEVIEDFKINAVRKNITVETIGITDEKSKV